MNSPFANIFMAIRQRTIDLKDGNGKSYFFVDRDLQQLNLDKPPVKFPCVLIGGLDFPMQQLTENAQRGTGSITIKICFTPYSAVSSLKEQEFVEKGIDYFNLEQIVHMALQGWHPVWLENGVDLLGNVAGSLIRTDVRGLPRNDDIVVRQITYSLGIDDFSTKKVKGTAPRPNINIVGI